MTYTPDITGFPYWKNKDKSEKKSLKKENKFYLKKIEKIKKKNKEEWESGTEKIGQQLSDALEENKKLKQEIRELKCKKDENFKKAAEGWATIRGLKDIIKRKDDLINEAVSKREYDRLWDENASNEEEIKELKEERDFFHQEFHKTLQHQADDTEQYEKEIKELKEEKFDNMEELAKLDDMCLVDIDIFNKLMAQEEENKELKEELKAAKEVSVVYMKRYEQKAKEERQIDEICSRIKCDDTFGHLIGKLPHH